MRILIADTIYPDFLRSLPPLTGTYDEELAKFMGRAFGTFDAFSHYLRVLGHECLDVIVNNADLQYLWGKENRLTPGDDILGRQIEIFEPDVLLLQDLSIRWFSDYEPPLIAAQCSCAFDVTYQHYDVLFTSLPTHVAKFKALGVRAEYLPLAFDPRMLKDCGERSIDIGFVGGLGKDLFWNAGTDTLEAVARAFRGKFSWWGYKRNLESIPLLESWWGEKWGRDMYEIYGKSKIVVNRHGEVSQGYANNLRMFEATGMGAMLITEDAPNIRELFPEDAIVTYTDPDDLCRKIDYYLKDDRERAKIAKRGQDWTLTHHTYRIRMKRVSEVLTECLERKTNESLV